MPASIAQSKGNFDAGGTALSIAVTFDNPVSAGSTLILFANLFGNPSDPTITGITDTDTNTWAHVDTRPATGQPWFYETWKALNAVGSTPTITVAIDNDCYVGIAAIEVADAGDVGAVVSAAVTISGSIVTGAGIGTGPLSGISIAAHGYAGSGATISPVSPWTEVIEVDQANNAGCVAVETQPAPDFSSNTPRWNNDANGVLALISHVLVLDAAPTSTSQPILRRWGGVPHVGGPGIGTKGDGRMWGRRRSGIIVPRRFKEVA